MCGVAVIWGLGLGLVRLRVMLIGGGGEERVEDNAMMGLKFVLHDSI